MRAAAIAFAVAVLLALGGPVAAVAQGTQNTPPTELWQNYPLDAGANDDSTAPPDRAPRVDRTSVEPAPASDNGGPSPLILMIPPLIVAAGIAFTAARQRLRKAPLRDLLPRPASAGPRPDSPPLPSRAASDPRPAPVPPRAKPTPPRAPAPAPALPREPAARPPVPAAPPEPAARPPVPAVSPEPAPRRPAPTVPPEPTAPPAAAPPPEPAGAPAVADEPAPPAPAPAPPALPIAERRSTRVSRATDDESPRRLPSNRFARARADALGYVTVPSVDDADREELRRQVKRIRRACDAFELSLLELIPDDESTGPTPAERPGYRRVMRRLDRGDAACLVTTRVQRLASTAEEWVLLLDLLDELEIRLIVVDDALDTGATGGRDEAWALAGLEAPLAPGRP